ncbi:GtrA family protein [Halococcus thailandensis]|uniref:GtrA-like family protein n=1 Tax=Halococcus thailandensis JCM 13552 TaxID=1227457 RepID=M0N9R6_9EURY|nr:GtrA family protein [Halococcus thailandensis]EMA54318.1 GtrA-like family protein [Halococcus thailandensis JCM 13552]
MATDSRFTTLYNRTRIGQFVSVGVVGAVVETIIVAFLTAAFGTEPLLAKVIGAEASITIMFTINDKWTFADEGATDTLATARRWSKSHLVRVVGLAISFSVLFYLTSGVAFSLSVSGVEFWPTIANIIGIFTGMIANYVAESLFTWEIS